MNSDREPILDDSSNGILITPEKLKEKISKRKALSVFLLFVCAILYYEWKSGLDRKLYLSFMEIVMELGLFLVLGGFGIGLFSSLLPYKGITYFKKLFLFSLSGIIILEILLMLILGVNLLLSNRSV